MTKVLLTNRLTTAMSYTGSAQLKVELWDQEGLYGEGTYENTLFSTNLPSHFFEVQGYMDPISAIPGIGDSLKHLFSDELSYTGYDLKVCLNKHGNVPGWYVNMMT